MKILIVPFIKNCQSDANYFYTENLLSVLLHDNHTCAISCDPNNHFHHANIYPSPKVRSSLFFVHQDTTSYEEQLYYDGALSTRFLNDDYEHLRRTIQSFKPDLIITMDRFAAIVIGHKYAIPVWVIVHPTMFHNNTILSRYVAPLNTLLSHHQMPQIHYVSQLFSYCQRRIGFGPIEVSPFLNEQKVDRIGVPSIAPIQTARRNRISIFLNHTNLSRSRLTKMIRESFEGAPYQTYVYLPDETKQTFGNVSFLPHMKMDVLDGSIICIHDGDPYVFYACLARGILQIIITDHSNARYYQASRVTRNHVGLSIYEDELSIAKLYETYRHVVTNDKFYYYAQALRQVTLADGDLTSILAMLDQMRIRTSSI